MGRKSLRVFVRRPGNSQLVDAVSQRIGVNLKNGGRAFEAAYFPSALLQHIQNMSAFDLLK